MSHSLMFDCLHQRDHVQEFRNISYFARVVMSSNGTSTLAAEIITKFPQLPGVYVNNQSHILFS